MAYLPKFASTVPELIVTIRWEPGIRCISRVGFLTTLLTLPVSVTSLVMSYLGLGVDVTGLN